MCMGMCACVCVSIVLNRCRWKWRWYPMIMQDREKKPKQKKGKEWMVRHIDKSAWTMQQFFLFHECVCVGFVYLLFSIFFFCAFWCQTTIKYNSLMCVRARMRSFLVWIWMPDIFIGFSIMRILWPIIDVLVNKILQPISITYLSLSHPFSILFDDACSFFFCCV